MRAICCVITFEKVSYFFTQNRNISELENNISEKESNIVVQQPVLFNNRCQKLPFTFLPGMTKSFPDDGKILPEI
jgi:hypothetical protein